MKVHEYEIIGWICHGMDERKPGRFSTSHSVRKPPKIYRTKKVAERYGAPVAVYIKRETS